MIEGIKKMFGLLTVRPAVQQFNSNARVAAASMERSGAKAERAERAVTSLTVDALEVFKMLPHAKRPEDLN